MRASDTTSASAPLERELFLFGLSHQLRTVVDRLFMKRQVVAGSFQNVPTWNLVQKFKMLHQIYYYCIPCCIFHGINSSLLLKQIFCYSCWFNLLQKVLNNTWLIKYVFCFHLLISHILTRAGSNQSNFLEFWRSRVSVQGVVSLIIIFQ